MNMLWVGRHNNGWFIDHHKLKVTLVSENVKQTKVSRENYYVLDHQKPKKWDADAWNYMFPSLYPVRVFRKKKSLNLGVSSVPPHCSQPTKQDWIQKKVGHSKPLWGVNQKPIFWWPIFVEHDHLVSIHSRRTDSRETWQRIESEKWIGKMSEGALSSTIAVSCPEKSIHHFHIFVSWLTLAIARMWQWWHRGLMRCRRGWLVGVWGRDGQTRCGMKWG